MAGFRKKQPEQAALKYGIYGPAGGGKSTVALLLAEGLAKRANKKIAYVDTEHGTDFYAQKVPERAFHPEAFDFDALDSRSIIEILSSVRSLNTSEYGVVVVDSITHVWEAAKNSYDGKLTSKGSIPMYAWGKIKKPYKDLMAVLLNSPMHAIICGRQGNEFAEDEETGEVQAVGVKMKAEGETPYEPHILLRMMPSKAKDGSCIYRAFAEKDRSGILAGRMFQLWPGDKSTTFNSLCHPLLKLLGDTQASLPDEDETAAKDAAAISEADETRARESRDARDHFEAHFKLAKTVEELNNVGKTLTPAAKKRMLSSDVAFLKEVYRTKEKQLTGGYVPEPGADESF